MEYIIKNSKQAADKVSNSFIKLKAKMAENDKKD
jgi:hypothetical protein